MSPQHTSRIPLLLVGLFGCGSPVPEPDDAPEADTPSTDTVAPPDTLETEETNDTPDDTPEDTPADTVVPLSQPPTSWGGGFVDVSGTLLTTDAFDVFPGDRATGYEPDTTSALWTDLDGDHTPEVLISTRTTWQVNRVTDRRVFRWVDGGLQRAPDLEARLPALRSALLLTHDLDQDGHDELVQAHGEALFWSDGDGWQRPLDFSLNGERRAFSMSAAPWDFDHDGRTDLLTGDGLCDNSVTPFLQDTPGELVRHAERLPGALPLGARADSILAFELPDDRTVLAAVGISCDLTSPHPGFLVEDAPDAGTYTAADLLPDDTLIKIMPAAATLPFTVSAPMGASVTDLDNDGVLDLLLSLGFDWITVLKGLSDGSFADRTTVANLASRDRDWGTAEITWSLAHPDLDQDGQSDILLTIGDDATSFHLAEGYTVDNRAWWNGGDFRFVDVGAAVGLSIPGGWKTLAMADPDRDGDADLLLGGRGMLPHVLRNDIVTANHGFSLQLHGTTSNPTGLGAMVDVEVAGLPIQHRMMGNEGNCGGGSPALLFFGTGTADHADRVRVRWPSGYEQELVDVSTGTMHEITEPELIRVTPASRQARADGQAIVEVRLLPALADGSPDPTAPVTLQLAGPGTLIDGPTWDGAAWVAHVQAPNSAGRTGLIATLGATPIRVHPQIVWEP
jgi:hypothetical protein